MALLDIHTHNLPVPEGSGLYSLPLGSGIPPHQFCSAGIHPWNMPDDAGPALEWVGRMLENPNVLAVGEAGLDRLRGGDIEVQNRIFTAQVELSERYGKPVVLHVVKCIDEIVALRRSLRPSMPWLIHGFRGGPELLELLTRHGFLVSFGHRFNPASLAAVRPERLFLETDGFTSFRDVLSDAAACLGRDAAALANELEANVSSFLQMPLDR